MYISSKTLDLLHKTCIEQVKSRIENRLPAVNKHVFHESAHFEILDPTSFYNPVSYDGVSFSHSETDSLFDKETDHYNQLIQTGEIRKVIDCLEEDGDSKKAYLSFWRNDYIFGMSGEIPCLIGVHFFTEEDKLFSVVQMRSNELLKLLPIDICFGIALQKYLAESLQKQLGSYTHQVASLVLYAQDIDYLK